MTASDHLSPGQSFYGSGKLYQAGDELDDTHGSGLWLTQNQQAASHYSRLNAMGRREYFGDAEASPHVYHVEPTEGLQPRETGYQARRARVVSEVEYERGNREPSESYTQRVAPDVLGD